MSGHTGKIPAAITECYPKNLKDSGRSEAVEDDISWAAEEASIKLESHSPVAPLVSTGHMLRRTHGHRDPDSYSKRYGLFSWSGGFPSSLVVGHRASSKSYLRQKELECSEKHIYNGTLPGSAFLQIYTQKKNSTRTKPATYERWIIYTTGIRSSVAGSYGDYNHMRRLTYSCKSQQPFIQAE